MRFLCNFSHKTFSLYSAAVNKFETNQDHNSLFIEYVIPLLHKHKQSISRKSLNRYYV